MTECPPERLEASDVLLRRIQVDDADLIARSVAANVEWLSRWMSWAVPLAGTMEEQHRRLPRVVASWEEGHSFQYLAVHARTGAHLGNFGLERRIGPRTIEIGYWLVEEATGHGYATAAVRVLTHAALALTCVDWVEIHTDRANLRSAMIPKRLGYRLDRVEPDGVRTSAESGQSMIWIAEQPRELAEDLPR